MGVQPGALAVGVRAQGEEILENAAVDDDAADQCHQHEHGGDGHYVHADPAGVEVVVQGEEEQPADSFRHGLAGGRIQGEAHEFAFVGGLVTGPIERLALARWTDPDGVGVRRLRQHGVAHLVHSQAVAGGCVQRWPHPALQLLVEAGDAAGEEDDEEQPGRQQAAPGVQPRHGLAQAHGRTPEPVGR
ncbi:hypothetical protein D3C84_646540 [compost metagenome]